MGAEQTGHSVRTERLHYGISAESLAGPSVDVLPLFLDASGQWQVEMHTVPGNSTFSIHYILLTNLSQVL